MNIQCLYDAQAEALFVSDLQPSHLPSDTAVRAAVARTIRAYGSRGCAARVAQEYGEHPETAVSRMTWARHAVERLSTARPRVLATAA